MQVWDLTTGAIIGEPLVGHSHKVTCVAFSPDSKQIISGSLDKTIRLWRTRSLTHPWPLTTFGLPPLPDQHGWVSLDQKSLLLWLPVRYRRPYDPRALYSISSDPAFCTISLDFSKFVHGGSLGINCFA